MPDTPPSKTSVTALYLSNWQDMVAIWKARKLTQTDPARRGPCLGELHFLGGPAPSWPINQIFDYSGFFRDESANLKYTAIENFDSEAWFESSPTNAGTVTTNYLTYLGAATQPRCQITRSYAAVPNHPFIVVRYTLTNPTNQTIVFNVFDQIHLANQGQGDPSRNVHAWYDSQRNALIADMSASGQFFVILGAFQPMDGHQVGDESVSSVADPTVAGWYSFDNDGTLKNNNDLQAGDVDLGFNQRVTLPAGGSSSLFFYLTVRGDQVSALAAADSARSQPGSAWFDQTATAYTAWLINGGKGRRLNFPDAGLNNLFDRDLIAIKNIQNPVLGTFSASTNPQVYGYKNWVRDGSITAIALDASGHYYEAGKYWLWMANMQGSDGTWKTTFSDWTGAYIAFVEPEYDSIGAFLYGVYRHYLLSGDSQFLSNLWPNVQRAADWIISNISSVNGLGAVDFSIWEEPEKGLEHISFTQAWYVAGLFAAQCLAEIRGDTALTDWYAGGPASIMTALQRPSDWGIPGVWNPQGYFNRAIRQDDSVDTLEDSSSDMLVALGVIDHESGRAASHIATMKNLLTHDVYGLARYQGDIYYYTSIWDPAGDEVGAPEPVWPQMSMWVAIYEMLTNQKPAALARLQWFVTTTGRGYMPPGEAVSNVTGQSVLSSMSEPLTAASFILAALFYENFYDLRIMPPIYNAGTFLSMIVSPGTKGDLPQWSNIPYFVASRTPKPNSPMTAVKRVFLTNDAQNIYLRIDNRSGALSGYTVEPKFALRVYSDDFAHAGGQTLSLGLDNQSNHRPMSYAVERHSDENVFRHWSVKTGAWVQDSIVGGVIVPQWDSTAGRLEAVIPISALSSTNPGLGNAWANLVIALASHNPTTNAWIDDGKILIHYRLSAPNQPWIYGNIEQAT
jgi:GH15 family glucan-1,4-alpha-glucosidase